MYMRCCKGGLPAPLCTPPGCFSWFYGFRLSYLLPGRCAADVYSWPSAMKKGRLAPPLFLLSGLAPSLRLPMLPEECMQDGSYHQGQKGYHRVSHRSRSAFISSLMYLPLLGCWFSHSAFSLSRRNDIVFWLREPWAAYALRTRPSSSFFLFMFVDC